MIDLTTVGLIFIMGSYCLAALIDFREYRLPDWLTWPAAIISVPTSLEMGRIYPDMLFGIVLAAGTLFFLYQKGCVGFGDVKLGFSIGALAGFIGTALVLPLAFLVLICWSRLGGSEEHLIPFGPILIGCVFLALLFVSLGIL